MGPTSHNSATPFDQSTFYFIFFPFFSWVQFSLLFFLSSSGFGLQFLFFIFLFYLLLSLGSGFWVFFFLFSSSFSSSSSSSSFTRFSLQFFFFFFFHWASLSLSLSLFSLASLFHHQWPGSGRAWAHLDFLVVVRRLLSKDGCRFVLGQAGDGFLLVGFGSFIEIYW